MIPFDTSTINSLAQHSQRRLSGGEDTIALPCNFKPDQRHVICGRGKAALEHSGNLRFKSLIEEKLEEYSKANSKTEKSRIVTLIFEQIVRDGSFVRKEKNGWRTVKESLAREKISQGFRNHLNDQYQSSKAAKQKKRKELREEVQSFGTHPKRVKLEYNVPSPSRTLRRTSDAYRQLMKFSNIIARGSLSDLESEEGPEEVISNDIAIRTDEKEPRRLSINSVLCDDFNAMEEISQRAFDAHQRGQGNSSYMDAFSL